MLGLFLYPDQPILTASLLEYVGREVASTGLGVVAFAAFLMAAVSSVIAGALYETQGFAATMYYVAALFALAAVVFLILPMSREETSQRSHSPGSFGCHCEESSDVAISLALGDRLQTILAFSTRLPRMPDGILAMTN